MNLLELLKNILPIVLTIELYNSWSSKQSKVRMDFFIDI